MTISNETRRQAKKHFDLQTACVSILPEDQDIVHVRTLEEWIGVLQSPNHMIVSIHENADCKESTLISHAVVILPCEKNPDADMLDMILPDKPDKVSTLSSVMTHPDHRGKDLMNHLIKAWKVIAADLGRNHLLSLITTTNPQSWSQFLKEDILITGAGFDPSDNSITYFAHLDMSQSDFRKEFNGASIAPLLLDPHTKLEHLKEIFALGYRGFIGEKNAQTGRYTGRLYLAKRKVESAKPI